MNKPVLVIGAGGHASVIIEILLNQKCTILGIVSKIKPNQNGIFENLKWFKSDDDVLSFDKDKVLLVNAIGFLPGNNIRFNIHKKFRQLGYIFMTVIAPSVILSKNVKLGQDVHLMPGCIVNTNSCISHGTILNSGSIVEHDCKIGPYNHIAPGAKLSGGVETDECVFIKTWSVDSESSYNTFFKFLCAVGCRCNSASSIKNKKDLPWSSFSFLNSA